MEKIGYLIGLLVIMAGCGSKRQIAETNEISHEDFFVASSDGVKLFVREFKPAKDDLISEYPLLLLHGGGPGAVASFDLDVQGGSLAKDLTKKGIKVYIMNIRGWGKSTLPVYDEEDSTMVIGNYTEAYEDIDAVVEFIRRKDAIEKVSLFGWATGGHWGGYYATRHSDKLSHFISLNSLYGVNAPWELRHFFWQQDDTTRFQRKQLYRTSDREGLVRKWSSTIPIENKHEWRDSLVMEAYRNTAVSFGRDKDKMTVPGGYREESFYMSLGRKYWNASDITVPSLIMRTELDFWSRPADLIELEKDLSNSPKRRIIEIPGTHYVFLDRPERGRDRLIEEVVSFIGAE